MASYGFKDKAIISTCDILGFSRTIKGSENWITAELLLEQFRVDCPNCEVPIHIDRVEESFQDADGNILPQRIYYEPCSECGEQRLYDVTLGTWSAW